MKHKLKIIFSILLCCLLAFVGVFSYVSIKNANAVTTSSDTSHVVNFYGEDNKTVIYSVNVENGQTLNDLQNSYINSNTSFDNSLNGYRISTDISSSDYSIAYNSFSGFNITYSDNSWFNVSFDNFINTQSTLYEVINCSDTSLIRQLYFSYYVDGIQYYPSREVISLSNNVYIVCQYDIPVGSEIRGGFQFSATGNSLSVNYFALSYNLDDLLNYFSFNYIFQLYTNSGGVIGDNFEWSESPTSSSKFTFDTPITSDINLYGYTFSGQTIDYTGTLSTDYSNFGNYAIDNVEFVEVSGVLGVHFKLDTSLLSSNFKLIDYNFVAFSGSSLSFPNSSFGFGGFCSFNLTTLSNLDSFYCVSDNSSSFVFSQNSNLSYSVFLVPNTGLIDLYFYSGSLNFSSSIPVVDTSSVDTYRVYDNVDSFVDMKEGNNLPLYINDFDNYVNFFNGDNNLILGTSAYYFNNTSWVNLVSYVGAVSLNSSLLYSNSAVNIVSSRNCLVNITDFFVFVHKPSYRVDNTLVIYNYDYSFLLDDVNFVSYQLQKDFNFYNVNYSGVVTNSYFVYISNDDVANINFDEYVKVDFSFSSDFINFTYSNGYYNLNTGFDFNFTYYVQPLVSNNGIYNYTFEKPGYVEMPFSLYPFYIPVLEIVQNAFIFLLFYCPIFSDIVELLNFDMFFGSLLNIFDFITTSAIGEFVYACLGFLIFWSLLKGLFPALVSSGRGVYSNSYFAYMYDNIKHEKDFNRKNKYSKLYRSVSRRDLLKSKGIKFGSARGYSDIHKFKAKHFNYDNRVLYNHLSNFKYVGYRGSKSNVKLKNSINRIAKMKKR